VCGWQVKLCDPLVTHGPYLSVLEINQSTGLFVWYKDKELIYKVSCLLLLYIICLEIHSLTLSLFIRSTDKIFGKNLLFVAENHVSKHCNGVCNGIILMP